MLHRLAHDIFLLSPILPCVPTLTPQEAWQEVVALGKDGAELKGLMHIERVECKGQLDGYVLVCNVFARLVSDLNSKINLTINHESGRILSLSPKMRKLFF